MFNIFNKRHKKEEDFLNSFGKIKNSDFDFQLISSYFKRKEVEDLFQKLSDKTCNDLDFEELFMYVDRTSSKVGQQYLYNRLRTIPSNFFHIAQEEKIIKNFASDSEYRAKIQLLLSKVNRRNAYYISSLFQEDLLQPPKWYFIIKLLSFSSVLCLVFLFINPVLLLPFLLIVLANFGIHYWNKQNLVEYAGSIPQLLTMNEVAGKLTKDTVLKELNPEIATPISILKNVSKRLSFFNFESKIQSDSEIFVWSLIELIKIVFLLEPLLLFSSLGIIKNHKKEIEAVFSFVGEVDSLISISSLRAGLNSYCHPRLLDKKMIVANEIYHPLIENCVKNSINIIDKSILLTGSNMSGKTSFIRTIGINAICGLTINTCYAKQFELPPLNIYSAIRISDDLMNDKSYYFEEVLTIKEIIDKSKSNSFHLFLLDEIFKGTNTIERIAAGKAVLSALNKNNNITFVSTHDIELADLLKTEYDLYHFSEVVDNNSVDFDYKLKEGKLKNRNAIRILQINDYPQEIIDEAIKLSENGVCS